MNKIFLNFNNEERQFILDKDYNVDFTIIETGYLIHIEHKKNSNSFISSLIDLNKIEKVKLYIKNQLLIDSSNTIIYSISTFSKNNLMYDLLEIFISR